LLTSQNAEVTDDLQGSEKMRSLHGEFHDAQHLRQILHDKKQVKAKLKISDACLDTLRDTRGTYRGAETNGIGVVQTK